jgi:putative ABC transport system permease protein
MLAFKLLLRNWRSGELKLLGISLVLAVAVLGAIAIFTDRLNATLIVQSNSVLGADTVVAGSQPHSPEWEVDADKAGVKHTAANEFMSVVYAGDQMLLSSIKAVADGYPLRGQFEISEIPFTLKADEIRVAQAIPAQGEAWVDSRLFSALNLTLGDKVAVGDYELTVTHILIREPDGTNPLSAFGARLLMNIKDLPKTNVIQPGSDVKYRWLLASDNESSLNQFVAQLKPKLSAHQRLVTLQTTQDRLSNTLNVANNFLLLTAIIAVLLAGVAIAIASKQFSERHTNQVALMKSLGVSANRVRSLYFSQLLLLAAVASSLGLVLGAGIQTLLVTGAQTLYETTFAAPGIYPFVLSFASGIICLVCFALPALWFLPKIPPLKILRKELSVSTPQVWMQGLFATCAIVLLVALFSRNLELALTVTLALFVVLLVTMLVAYFLLKLTKRWLVDAGGAWRLAFASIQKNSSQSVMKILVFAIAMMLLITVTILRTSLINEWKIQIPENAPNHYLTNIPKADVQSLQQLLEKNIDQPVLMMPNVRGRLVAINGQQPSDEMRQKHNSLQRELNLTWTADLPVSNKLVDGEWWDTWKRTKNQPAGVSVEEGTAKDLGLKLGDSLQFSIGGLTLDAEVASIRSLEWKSMRLNFFFIFEPGSLEQFSPTYMSSIYLDTAHKSFLYKVLREHPSVLLIEFDRIIDSIRKIMDQVAEGVQLVLYLTLVGGCLVLWAAVMGSLESRKQEAGLLRALGASRQLIVGGVLIEFAIMGLLAGIVAVLGAEFLLLSLQKYVFKIPLQPHFMFWFLSPLLGCFLVAVLGLIGCRPVLTTPPAIVLREAA